jgi:hypothetical protein
LGWGCDKCAYDLCDKCFRKNRATGLFTDQQTIVTPSLQLNALPQKMPEVLEVVTRILPPYRVFGTIREYGTVFMKN